ncbi:MAG: carboxypeptidase-like regulatory domain-containing protein [Gemmatimonadota bacterium]|nr:carboxypeptidase-like regulatory domain-containing protein [Gemmatimonadota bacterium]
MRRLTLLGLLFASALAPGALEGQTLTGNVQDQATGQPLASAQVYIAGLDIGGLTQANGDYLLLNVPPGTHAVTVQQLGYQTQSREVTVATGQTAVQGEGNSTGVGPARRIVVRRDWVPQERFSHGFRCPAAGCRARAGCRLRTDGRTGRPDVLLGGGRAGGG